MAISRVGAVAAASTSLTPSTGTAGDVFVAFAFRSSSATVPTVPSGWTTITSGSGNTCAGVIAYQFCTGTGGSSGTWTNATDLVIVRYSGVYGIGGSASSNATGTSISYPALTLVQASSTSWAVGFAGHRTATNVGSQNPTGMTAISGGNLGGSSIIGSFDTNATITSWTAQSATVNASSGHESFTLELLGGNSTLNPYYKATNTTLSSANMTGALNSSAQGLIQATYPRASGKWVFAVTTSGITSLALGISNISITTTGDADGANAASYFNFGGNAFFGNNGTDTSESTLLVTSTKYYIAVDLTNNLFWIKAAGGNWNNQPLGNPDTGVDGYSYTLTGPYYPFIGGLTNADGGTYSGTDTGSGLSNFTPWDTNSSPVTGSVAVTEAQDTLAATGKVLVSGHVAVTEAQDSFAATGTVLVSGHVAVTEAQDNFAATGKVLVSGHVAVTEAQDNFAATGKVLVSGQIAVTETQDSLAASASVFTGGSAALQEIQDALAATGTVLVSGAAVLQEIQDSLAAQGTAAQPTLTGSIAITEAQDNFAAIGNNGLIDTSDPGYHKRRNKRELRKLEEERERRVRLRRDVIAQFERIIEGKTEAPASVIDDFVAEVEAKRSEQPSLDISALIRDRDRVQSLWNAYLERDDEEVLILV